MDSLLFHPKLVHLPMALAVLMPLVAGGLLLAWRRDWLPSRAWVMAVILQLVLVVSGALALSTGEAEEERVERVVPERYIEAHEHAAQRFVLAGGVVFGLMLIGAALAKKPAGRSVAAVATVGTLGVLALGYQTGEAGGRLVYDHGAAQVYQPSGQGPAAPKVERSAHEDDD